MPADDAESFHAIRRRVGVLLTGLRAHQTPYVDLIYEAFCRNLGASD